MFAVVIRLILNVHWSTAGRGRVRSGVQRLGLELVGVVVVALLVNLERAALSCGVFTKRALEWFLARMNPHVHLQMTPLDGGIRALAAFERLDARVLGRVLGQVDLLVESCTANIAVERRCLLALFAVFLSLTLAQATLAASSVIRHLFRVGRKALQTVLVILSTLV